LTRHECIEFRAEGAGRVTRWPLTDGSQHIEFTPGNRFSVNGVAMARRLAMLGAGIAVLVGGQLAEQQSGQLQRVLPDWQLGPFPVYAVTETRLLPAKTRIFIEFLMERLGSSGQAKNTPAFMT
jgi:DNA-binding transcriptional LysR family regulator